MIEVYCTLKMIDKFTTNRNEISMVGPRLLWSAEG